MENEWPGFADSPPPGYQPPVLFDSMIDHRDVMVPMRDGVRLCVDVYRPAAEGKFPALLALARHNKEMQTPEVAEALSQQPAWSPLWMGIAEAGDTRYLVSRGYVHVVGNPRGVGKSEDGGSAEWDLYDVIEWIAKQAWCDGNVGMVGISAFGSAQLQAAMQQPPHLKAIFPYDPRGAWDFRDRHPGGASPCFFILTGAVFSYAWY